MKYQLKAFSSILVLFSIIGFIFIFGPIIEMETRFSFNQLTGKKVSISVRPVSTDFDIIIPKINANSIVFQDVNASKYDEYIKILEKGVAHAKGTGLPGNSQKTNIFLFAHSSVFPWQVGRVNPVFYLLGKLETNDIIVLYYKGKQYNYEVFNKKIVDPSNVSDLNNPSHNNWLILQTCWPAGTNFKRMLIYARLV